MRLSLGSRRFLAAVLATWAVAGDRQARADEWALPKPKSGGTGNPITLKRSLGDAARLPVARVQTLQRHTWATKKREIRVDFDARATPSAADETGRAQVRLAVDLSRVAVDDDDLGPKLRAGGASVFVLSAVDAKGFVAQGTAEGAEGLGTLGAFLKPAGSWVLPYLPEKPVRVGEAWDLPIPYFLWSVNQLGAVPAEGFVTQVLGAIEDHDGIRCARVHTTLSLRRPQPKGMTPAAVEIGDGAALARLRGEGTAWIDLDGCLREEVLDVKMRIENTETKAWMEWTLHREAKARPRGAGPLAKDWSSHTGNLKFVVGFEPGMEQAWAAGRPAMLFFTSAKDKWCPLFGTRSWKDKEILDKIKAYLPVLVDADEAPELVKKYEVLLLPAVVWVDSEGNRLFSAVGDAPLELLRTVVETARDRAPEVGASPAYVAVMKAGDAMRAAVKSGDTHAALRAIHEIKEVMRPKALLEEAKNIEEQISKDGAEALAKAKQLVATGKKAEAKEALQKLKASYGDHPVGQEAWTLLRQLLTEGDK